MKEQEQKTADLGSGKVGRLLFRLAVPAITAQLVNMLYNIVDRMYIGHIPEIGAAALTGVGVTFPILMIISAFSSLIGMGGAPRASIKMGQKDVEGAEKILGNCFVTLVGISIILTVLFLILGEDLLLLFGASENTIAYGTQYLTIYVSGTIFVQMALGLNTFISAQGFAKTSMMTVIIGAISNIILDPIFIFVMDMGVRGAAVATIISQAISSAWVVRFLSGPKTLLRIRRENFAWRPSVMLPVLALGVSPFIMQSTESLVNICLNSSLQRYGGDLYVGAMTIMASVMQILMMPLVGLTQGAQPIISFNFGAGRQDRVKKAFKLLLTSSLIFTTVFWLLVMLCPKIFIMIFNNNPALVEITQRSMRIYMAGAFLLGAQIACQQTFLSLGQALITMLLAMLRKIILLIPLIYILPMVLADKVTAVFLAEPIADVLAAVTTVIVFTVLVKRILAHGAAPNADKQGGA